MQRTWLTSRSTLAASLLALAGAAGAGCIGDIGAGDEGVGGIDPPGHGPQSCSEGPQPGDAPIRRMTRFEYNNTVRDLLGDATHPADGFGAEEEALGFNNNAANLTTSSQLAEKYMLAAEGISERATADLASLLPCDVPTAGGMDEPCAKSFIDDFLTRAYRRPPTAAEKATFLGLWQAGKAEADFTVGVQLVIQAALQSPAFLYRVEFGLPADGGAEIVGLDDWEMASRLSYLLWGSMPDDELFAAAEAGELSTKEQVATQARRMLELPQAHDAVRNFHQQWLDYERIANVGKSADVFPDWSTAIGQLMREETETFIDEVVFEGEGDLDALLTAPYSYMNADLAAFYGIDALTAGVTGDTFQKVDLDPKERAGLLTTGTFLTINAHSNQTSPVHRGKLVREQLLCDLMPPPPKDVVIDVPEPDPDSSARERFAQHSEDPACSSCHKLMDPLGFGFENYDGIARFRTMENDEAIDASGTVSDSDVDGDFVGAVELAKKLAGSHEVQSCYAKQWFRYAYGRGETKADSCTTDWLDSKFADSGGNITELMVALTQTDAFFYRPAGGSQ